MPPMAIPEMPFGIRRSLVRLDRQDPYLCLHFVIVFASDLDRSLQFYRDQLGFGVVGEHTFENGQRWLELAPPDGTSHLELTVAKNADAVKLIGREAGIWFTTEDVNT